MAIINFIVSNYFIIAIIVIIIIFAVIGGYVDKIGYLKQAPVKKQKKPVKPIKPIENIQVAKPIEKPIVKPAIQPVEQAVNEIPIIEQPKVEEVTVPIVETKTDIAIDDIDSALFAPIEGNNEYDELAKEVNELLPKKEVIDEDLLSDINNLSLDKTQKYNFGDIPDLDDVVLPKIKKSDEPEDIWKF